MSTLSNACSSTARTPARYDRVVIDDQAARRCFAPDGMRPAYLETTSHPASGGRRVMAAVTASAARGALQTSRPTAPAAAQPGCAPCGTTRAHGSPSWSRGGDQPSPLVFRAAAAARVAARVALCRCASRAASWAGFRARLRRPSWTESSPEASGTPRVAVEGLVRTRTGTRPEGGRVRIPRVGVDNQLVDWLVGGNSASGRLTSLSVALCWKTVCLTGPGAGLRWALRDAKERECL